MLDLEAIEKRGARFVAVEPLDDTPVQFVGCYVLRWNKVEEPTIGFYRDEDFDTLLAEVRVLRQQVQRMAEAREAIVEFCNMNCEYNEPQCGPTETMDACKLWLALQALDTAQMQEVAK